MTSINQILEKSFSYPSGKLKDGMYIKVRVYSTELLAFDVVNKKYSYDKIYELENKNNTKISRTKIKEEFHKRVFQIANFSTKITVEILDKLVFVLEDILKNFTADEIFLNNFLYSLNYVDSKSDEAVKLLFESDLNNKVFIATLVSLLTVVPTFPKESIIDWAKKAEEPNNKLLNEWSTSYFLTPISSFCLKLEPKMFLDIESFYSYSYFLKNDNVSLTESSEYISNCITGVTQLERFSLNFQESISSLIAYNERNKTHKILTEENIDFLKDKDFLLNYFIPNFDNLQEYSLLKFKNNESNSFKELININDDSFWTIEMLNNFVVYHNFLKTVTKDTFIDVYRSEDPKTLFRFLSDYPELSLFCEEHGFDNFEKFMNFINDKYTYGATSFINFLLKNDFYNELVFTDLGKLPFEISFNLSSILEDFEKIYSPYYI